MPYGSIYKIPFPNGKHYIGLTTSVEERKKKHIYYAKNGDTRYVYNALRKYDMVDTFELIEIDTAETLEELCEKEIRYIQMYNSFDKEYGYNMTLGGEGTSGYVFTEEDKQKMSESQKKYHEENPEARQTQSEALKKYHEENPEARTEMSERMKKYHEENPETRKKHSEKMKKLFEENPEAKQKCSEAQKIRFEKTEARQTQSEALKKYHEENPEARTEMSERMKKYYEENSDAIQKNSERMKKYHEENPEARQKCNVLAKKYHEENPKSRQNLCDKKGQNKPFDIFTKDGIFVKTFTYQFEAKEYLRNEYKLTKNISVSGVLNGKLKGSAGFVFKYK